MAADFDVQVPVLIVGGGEPGVFDMADALGVWGPEIGPSGVEPDDLAELMAGLH